MDAQTHVEHSLALAALIQAMVKELAEHFETGEQLGAYPYEMLDENKWLAARHGLDGELVDLPERGDGAAPRTSRGASTTGCASTRQELGSESRAGGHPRPARARHRRARQRVVYEANHDWTELLREIVAATHG